MASLFPPFLPRKRIIEANFRIIKFYKYCNIGYYKVVRADNQNHTFGCLTQHLVDPDELMYVYLERWGWLSASRVCDR